MFTILIVDDNDMDRDCLAQLIDWSKLGITVAGTAADGLEGYEAAVRLMPDFVLTDIAMPLMDGIQMTEKLKRELPDTKVIFMSCYDDFEFAKNAINLDVYGYVLKPVVIGDIIQAVTKVRDVRQEECVRRQMEEEMRSILEKSMPLLQEQFIRDLLHGRIHEQEDIEERMHYLGRDLYKKVYTVLCLQIDNYEVLYRNVPVERKYMLIHQVKRIVEDTLLQQQAGYSTYQQYHELAVILFCDNEDRDGSLNRIIEAANRCREQINSQLNIHVTIGIGEMADKLSAMPRIFEGAEYAVKSKFLTEGNRIILVSEVKEPEGTLQYSLNDIKRELGQLLEQGEAEDVQAFVGKYYSKTAGISENHVKSLSFSIITMVQTILIEKNLSLTNVFDNETLIWEKLGRFETIVDIGQWVFNILDAVRQYLGKKEGGRYQKLVEDIKAIIDEKYSQIDNINQIVEPLYISASYANLKFKQCTGQTIFDHLIARRMEKAKQLLMEPHRKLYEIALDVGYKSPIYFSNVFKDYTGLSPKDYRDKYIG